MVPDFFQLFVAHRFASFRDPHDLDEVVGSDGRPGLAPEDVVEAGEGAAFVVQAIVIEERVADPPAGETIDDEVELVLGRRLGGRAVPGEDPVVEAMDRIDERHFEFQARRLLYPDRFAKSSHDRGLVLVNGKEERAPLQGGEKEEEADDREHRALHETDEAGGEM